MMQDLRKLVLENGGAFHPYKHGHTSHSICDHYTDAQIKQIQSVKSRVRHYHVTVQWLLDSVTKGRFEYLRTIAFAWINIAPVLSTYLLSVCMLMCLCVITLLQVSGWPKLNTFLCLSKASQARIFHYWQVLDGQEASHQVNHLVNFQVSHATGVGIGVLDHHLVAAPAVVAIVWKRLTDRLYTAFICLLHLLHCMQAQAASTHLL